MFYNDNNNVIKTPYSHNKIIEKKTNNLNKSVIVNDDVITMGNVIDFIEPESQHSKFKLGIPSVYCI